MTIDQTLTETIFAYLGAQRITLTELSHSSGLTERELHDRLKQGGWTLLELRMVAGGLWVTVSELLAAAEDRAGVASGGAR